MIKKRPLLINTSKISEHFFEDYLILLNHATNQLLVLNPLAKFVWQGFAQGDSKQQVIKQLTKSFQISRPIVAQDVKQLCQKWYNSYFYCEWFACRDTGAYFVLGYSTRTN